MYVTCDADPIWLYSLGKSSVSDWGIFTCPLHLQSGVRGHPCLKSSWCSTVPVFPTRDAWAHLFKYVSLALRHEETVTETFGTWQSPAELNRQCLKAQRQEISLRSQKAALIASDMCIPFPSDATSLFCLDHLCICIHIFVLRVCECVCVTAGVIFFFFYPDHSFLKLKL